MTRSDRKGARGDDAEPQVPSGESEADTDIDSSSTVNGYRQEGSTESELSCDSNSDPVAEIVLQAEQLGKGIREVAQREAVRQTLAILAEAEIKAREQILEPAAAQAASESKELLARAEREAEAILSGVQRLFGRSSDADYADDSSTVDGPKATANGTKSKGPRNRPQLMSPAQRDQVNDIPRLCLTITPCSGLNGKVENLCRNHVGNLHGF